MQALDFVKTPKGNLAIIQETNNNGEQASIWFIGEQNPDGEQNAWWSKNELVVIDSLPYVLSVCMCHPFGGGRKDAVRFFNPKRKIG